jgi:hypothetical protein
MRHDAITRVMGEHVVNQATFNELWRRQLGNPKAFWAPYPLPSALTYLMACRELA